MKPLPVFLIMLTFISSIIFTFNVIAATAIEPQTEVIDAPQRFGFADVHRRAAELAKRPFVDDSPALPEFLRNLSYDQYRDISFRGKEALWREEGLPFVIQLFHRGFLFTRAIAINIVEKGEVNPFVYDSELFEYKQTLQLTEPLPTDLGFAGLKIFYPLEEDKSYNEFAVFLGASYFRAVGQKQSFGLSARGLAIDTGLASGEEFPFFKEFWLEKPDKDATMLTVYALLDSPSVSGAYRFVLKPGIETLVEVKATIFLRKPIQKLGIAPLTSMFFHGENSEQCIDDFRPEIHDSDGLLLNAGSGEWIWRPLTNGRDLHISNFHDTNPKGFGLLQRDREFAHYQDIEAFYHQRPNAWVEPLNDWGKGVIQLVEIPSNSEYNDNMVAFWIPEEPTEAGQELTFEYQLHFAANDETLVHGGSKAVATHIGKGDHANNKRRFVIDFIGKSFATFFEVNIEKSKVEAIISSSSGKVINIVSQKNPFTQGWRTFFELVPEDDHTPIELRCFLKSGEDVLTETWSYQWSP